MNNRSDTRVALVVAATAVATFACLALALASAGARVERDALLAAVFLGPLIVAGRAFPVPLAFRRRMVTDTAPLFAASLILPWWMAAAFILPWVATAECISGRRSGQLHRRQVLFNSCQALLGTVAAALVFGTLAPGGLGGEDGHAALGALAAAGAMLAVSDLLVFLVVWAQMGLALSVTVRDFVRGRSDLPYDLALYGAGLVAALVATVNPWLVTLVAAPLPVLYRAMEQRVALREQTKAAVIALADTVDDRDPYTFGHCRRVAQYTQQICARLGLAHDDADEIVLAARVHDVGKIGIRDAVLLKPGRLTEDEFIHIKEHPDIGARLTARFPEFARGTLYVRHHHEKFDGSGYPSGLSGKQIPLGARIIASPTRSTRSHRRASTGRSCQTTSRARRWRAWPARSSTWRSCRRGSPCNRGTGRLQARRPPESRPSDPGRDGRYSNGRMRRPGRASQERAGIESMVLPHVERVLGRRCPPGEHHFADDAVNFGFERCRTCARRQRTDGATCLVCDGDGSGRHALIDESTGGTVEGPLCAECAREFAFRGVVLGWAYGSARAA